MHCLMCEKYFFLNLRIAEHLQKKTPIFFGFPVKDINISEMFYKIQNLN